MPLIKMYPGKAGKGSEVTTIMDIVAIHGLDTSSQQTWSAFEKEGDKSSRLVNWLQDKDMLPNFFPDARILDYDWNANTFSNASGQYFHDHAETFLSTLEKHRRKRKGHPIIFVASCYGGLIVAKALLLASTGHSDYKHILDATVGIVFLGTPFRGSDGTSAAQTRVQIAKMIGHQVSETLLSILEKQSGTLNEIRHEFVRLLRNRWKGESRIVCFYETRVTSIYKAVLSERVANLISQVLLVDKDSACLDGWDCIALDVNHPMLNKFRGPKDRNYKLVAGEIHKLAEKARADVRARNLSPGYADGSGNIFPTESYVKLADNHLDPQESRSNNMQVSSPTGAPNNHKGRSKGEDLETDKNTEPSIKIDLPPQPNGEAKGQSEEIGRDNYKLTATDVQPSSSLPIMNESKSLLIPNGFKAKEDVFPEIQSSFELPFRNDYDYRRQDNHKQITRRARKGKEPTENTASKNKGKRKAYRASSRDTDTFLYSEERFETPVPRTFDSSTIYPAPYDSSVRSPSPEPDQYIPGPIFRTFTNSSSIPSTPGQSESRGGLDFAGLGYGIISGAAGGALVYAGSVLKGSQNTDGHSKPNRTGNRLALPVKSSMNCQEKQFQGKNEDLDEPLNGKENTNEGPWPENSVLPDLNHGRGPDPTTSTESLKRPVASVRKDPSKNIFSVTEYTESLSNPVPDTTSCMSQGDAYSTHSTTGPLTAESTEHPTPTKSPSSPRALMQNSTIIQAPADGRKYENLENRFRVVESKEQLQFWQAGRVFMALWNAPASNRLNSGDGYETEIDLAFDNKPAFSGVRRFVVFSNMKGSAVVRCWEIKSYGGRGTLKLNVNGREHAMIYTSSKPPAVMHFRGCDGQTITEDLRKDPIKVIRETTHRESVLSEASRIDFGKVYTVKKSHRVLNIGIVCEPSIHNLRRYSEIMRYNDC